MASPMNLAQKIISSHLEDGSMEQGQEIGLRVDRVLMQDATGTMACLQFEAMGIPRVKVEHAAIYVDHNILQTGFENGDDHRFLQTFAAKYGIHYSKPGNGICHQVNLERFSIPGKLLIGSDSHTPTAGGAGMMAIGVGGLDVAVAMAGAPFYTKMPKIVGVKLTGRLRPWVTAKDVILEMLRRLSVKGGVGRIFEYYGEGMKSMGVPQRGTICNMGAELGATTSLFESDEITQDYMARQGRKGDYRRIAADPGCTYDENIEIDLSELEPMIALPGSPDAVHKVRDVQGTEVHQVLIGSCTNSSYVEMMTVAHVLQGKKIHPSVTMAINPGSKQVLETVARDGSIYHIIASGARLLESGPPLVYAAINMPKYDSVFFPNVQHYSSVSGDENRSDVSQTVLKPNVLTRWPNRVYTFLEPAFLIDWERDSKVGLTVELEVGKIVSPNIAIWGRPGVGVIKNDLPQIYNWNMEVGLRYIF